MDIQKILNQENNQRSQEANVYDARITGKDIHVMPAKPLEPEVIKSIMERETKDREALGRMFGAEPENSIDTPASIYHEIHGETMLRSVMELPADNAVTEQLNNYILEKMRVGKLQDNKENYEKVLDRLLAKNNLSRTQQKSYLLNKLSLYLRGNPDEEDDLVLSIIKRGKRRGF